MTASTERRVDARLEEAGVWCLRLAERELSPSLRAELDRWLAADPENLRAFERATHTWDAMEEIKLSPSLIEMRRSALEAYRRGHAAQWSGGRRRLGLRAAVAAALVLVVTGLAAWRYLPETFETGVGERQVIALDDGSKLSLDAHSRVDVRYLKDRRELWLKRGRAKFEVHRDPLRPFSVTAANKVVVATGTQFSVELLASQVRVILYEGNVDILATSKDPASPPKPLQVLRVPTEAARQPRAVALAPGRELIVGVNEEAARVRDVDPLRSLGWEAGQVSFTDEPLALAVERINRYGGAALAVGDATAARVRISGVFTAGDTEAFIEGVTGVFPLRVETHDGRQTFVHANHGQP